MFHFWPQEMKTYFWKLLTGPLGTLREQMTYLTPLLYGQSSREEEEEEKGGDRKKGKRG